MLGGQIKMDSGIGTIEYKVRQHVAALRFELRVEQNSHCALLKVTGKATTWSVA